MKKGVFFKFELRDPWHVFSPAPGIPVRDAGGAIVGSLTVKLLEPPPGYSPVLTDEHIAEDLRT